MNRPVQPDGRVHGVVFAIRQPGTGLYLAIRRAEGVAAPLKVCFPGGCVEAGESQEQAVVREAWEELNLRVRPLKHLWTWQSPQSALTLFGWAVWTEDLSTLRANPLEIAEIFWLSAEFIAAHPDAMTTNAAFCCAIEGYHWG